MGLANSHNAEFFMGEADSALREGILDYRAASAFALTSIAISLHRIAEAMLTSAAPSVPTCKRCGLPANAVIHSGRIEKAIGGHEFDSETDTENRGASPER